MELRHGAGEDNQDRGRQATRDEAKAHRDITRFTVSQARRLPLYSPATK